MANPKSSSFSPLGALLTVALSQFACSPVANAVVLISSFYSDALSIFLNFLCAASRMLSKWDKFQDSPKCAWLIVEILFDELLTFLTTLSIGNRFFPSQEIFIAQMMQDHIESGTATLIFQLLLFLSWFWSL
ncbi:hypothetical protein DSO57_1012739 [Entomophthora muscae]|uniref:Uncharacterized protein n=1 Tax=Entomophthora muscae TaxID=34485 RepID=A0ACC2U3P4_9FUNG|nr:hypothetical protein DSO57_1012739 [Entomophthora muscae]